jgi:predicted GIY-YIG superfamily endonuclease
MVLYTGITNDFYQRISEHYENSKPFRRTSVAGRCNANHPVYCERFCTGNKCHNQRKANQRMEKRQKEALINTMNLQWNFLHEEA